MPTKKPKDAMRLVGSDQNGKVVLEQTIPLYDYYEELHPVIDSDEFRKKLSLVKLVGTKFDESGELEEEWENCYSDTGAIVSGVVRDKHRKITKEMRIRR